MGMYSLWLEPPEGRLAEQLQAEVDRLRVQHGGPTFAPHVTLAAFEAGDDATAEDWAAGTAAKLAPIYVSFTDVGAGTIFHQCVFIRCAKVDALMTAAETAKATLRLPQSSYMPHLSLLYSDIDQDTRGAVVQEVQQRLYGEAEGYDTLLLEPGFSATELSLWRTDAEDKSLESWVRLGRFKFSAT